MNFDLCLVYLDDIVVFSKTLEEHTRRLELLFERLRWANLKLKPSKCHLMQVEIAFLGHVVSKDRHWYNEYKDIEVWQLIPPTGYRQAVFEVAHKSVSGGHFGFQKTRDRIQSKYY